MPKLYNRSSKELKALTSFGSSDGRRPLVAFCCASQPSFLILFPVLRSMRSKQDCESGELSIDNKFSERMVRPVAIGRKNHLFMGSDHGGKSAAILYSMMASAKAKQVEPFADVRDLLSQLLGCSPPAVATLLPDA